MDIAIMPLRSKTEDHFSLHKVLSVEKYSNFRIKFIYRLWSFCGNSIRYQKYLNAAFIHI